MPWQHLNNVELDVEQLPQGIDESLSFRVAKGLTNFLVSRYIDEHEDHEIVIARSHVHEALPNTLSNVLAYLAQLDLDGDTQVVNHDLEIRPVLGTQKPGVVDSDLDITFPEEGFASLPLYGLFLLLGVFLLEDLAQRLSSP